MNSNGIKCICSIALIFLVQGCYYWSYGINEPEISSSYKIHDFNYYEYTGYSDERQEEFVKYIEERYLEDIRDKIVEEKISLPSIALHEFSHIALIEKFKDPDFEASNWGSSSKRDAKRLTILTKKLLDNLKIFQSVTIVTNDMIKNEINVIPSVAVYDYGYSPIGQAFSLTAFLTWGIVSPANGKEIVQIKFDLVSNLSKEPALLLEGVGGGFTAISSVWMTDNPNILNRMQRKAFGIAFRGLVLDIIDQQEEIKLIGTMDAYSTRIKGNNTH